MLKSFKTSTLLQVAGGGFVSKVRNLPHYKECFNIVSNHEKFISLLGQPIKVGHVDLSDRKNNFIGKETSQLRIPVSGEINSGFLNVYAQRIPSEDKENNENMPVGLRGTIKANFITSSIELETDDQTILIYQKK